MAEKPWRAGRPAGQPEGLADPRDVIATRGPFAGKVVAGPNMDEEVKESLSDSRQQNGGAGGRDRGPGGHGEGRSGAGDNAPAGTHRIEGDDQATGSDGDSGTGEAEGVNSAEAIKAIVQLASNIALLRRDQLKLAAEVREHISVVDDTGLRTQDIVREELVRNGNKGEEVGPSAPKAPIKMPTNNVGTGGGPSIKVPSEEPVKWATAGNGIAGLALIGAVDSIYFSMYDAHMPVWMFTVILVFIALQTLITYMPKAWVIPWVKAKREEKKRLEGEG